MALQHPEIWDQDDDWTGVSNAKERRRRQNRIHQRAYRAKRRLQKFPNTQSKLECKRMAVSSSSVGAVLEDSLRSRQEAWRIHMAILDQLPILLLVRCTELHEKIRDFLQRAYTNWALNLPTACDLPVVTRLNTFDALARNALLLQIPFEYLETDDHVSVFNLRGPMPLTRSEPPSLPTHLAPTTLQKSVAHHSWLDLFPIPGMRDNILRGIGAGVHDEDELCDALCCDLLNCNSSTKAAILVWGESWDATGWEFSASFFAKWGVLLQGCPEVLDTANYWRQKRGASRIGYDSTCWD